MDDKTPTMPTHTTTTAKHLNKPVGELRLGADNDVSTLVTQENPVKNLVYITNMLLKNPYSRFGLIFSCADQFNSWCSPMLRCLFTCIFHNL